MRFRTLIIVGLVGLCGAAPPEAHEPIRPNTSDWLQFVPADARLYVEFRNLSRIREHLRELKIWTAIKTLSDRAEPSAASQAWQKRPQVILGMTPEEAVTQVLGFRTAVIARDPWRWKQGLVLAQLPPRAVGELLRRWRAQSVNSVDSVQQFALGEGSGLRVARRGHLMLFGPAGDHDGLWEATVSLMAGQSAASLADDADIQTLAQRVTRGYDGLVIARGTSSTPTHDLGVRLLAALRFEKTQLEIDAEWLGDDVATGLPRSEHTLVAQLPADTLACWSGSFDGAEWLRRVQEGSAGPLWRMGLQLSEMVLGEQAITAASMQRIGPEVVFALNREPEAEMGYQAPVVSMIVEARDRPRAAEELSHLASILIAFINTQLARSGARVVPIQISESSLGGYSLFKAPIGEALGAYSSCPYLKRLSLVWVQTSDRLIISTSEAMVRRLVLDAGSAAASQAAAPGMLDLLPRGDGGGSAEWLCIRGTSIARMLQSWLDYARKRAPHALQVAWWTKHSAVHARESERLRVTVRSLTRDGPAAEVLEVEPDSPATGVLEPGDVIVSVEGRPLTSDRPAREIGERFRARALGDSFSVEFLRGEQRRFGHIEISDWSADVAAVDPVTAIRPLIALGRRISLLAVMLQPAQTDSRSARIIVRWQPPEPERPKPPATRPS